MSQPAAYDLYLDESGLFLETSTDPAEVAASLRHGQRFPSQLAGLLVPRGALTAGAARAVVQQSLKDAGLPPPPLHATDLRGGDAYDRLVQGVLARLPAGCQPVRLVNQERVRYGDRAATYTNLVAELVLRICQQKHKEGQPRLSLRLYCARVKLGESADGTLQFLERGDYLRRVTEYLAQAAVRHGFAGESAAWRLDELHLRGKDDAEVQLCDLVSNASHDDFRRCGPEAQAALRQALGAYDFRLVFRELLERVDLYVADGSLGLAVIALAERLSQDDVSEDLRTPARERLGEVLARLAGLGAPARDAQLAIPASWLEQVIEQQRSLEVGRRLARWLLTEAEPPLRRAVTASEQPSLDWFAYALHTWALTACNHLGDLRDARRETEFMERLLPSLAGRWEHATLLMRGLVAQAVHQTDCFDHAAASARMTVVAGYYGQLGELFHAALPAVFPERVRSDLHGRALGTWLQSEILAGLREPARLEAARALSERAIDEFPAESEKERQYQYRSQLETAAGAYAEARRFLARSLRLAESSHEALGAAIANLGRTSTDAQCWALLHWFRLGATAALDGTADERDAFLKGVESAEALDGAWCAGRVTDEYPTHGILRRAAVIRALRGEPAEAVAALRRLGEILAGDRGERLVLQAIRLAAHAETAALLAERHPKPARRLLDGKDAAQPGLLQQLQALEAQARPEFPGVWRLFADWPDAVRRALEDGAWSALARLGRGVGY